MTGSARLSEEATAERVALGEQYEADLVARRDRLRQQLCSPPPAVGLEAVAASSSFRDALERGQPTELAVGESNELLALQRTARTISDPLLERAMLVVAIERSDVVVLNAWVAAHPPDEAKLQELLDLEHALPDTRQTFVRALNFVGV